MAEWFDYDCPDQGMDFDIEPPPMPGDVIACSACGGIHIASLALGQVFRHADNEFGLEVIDSEWLARLRDPLAQI